MSANPIDVAASKFLAPEAALQLNGCRSRSGDCNKTLCAAVACVYYIFAVASVCNVKVTSKFLAMATVRSSSALMVALHIGVAT